MSFFMFYQKKPTFSRFHTSFRYDMTMATTPLEFLKTSQGSHFWVGSLQWANGFFNINPFSFISVQDSVFVEKYCVDDIHSHYNLPSLSPDMFDDISVTGERKQCDINGFEDKKRETTQKEENKEVIPPRKNKKSILIETEFFKSCHIKAEMKNGVLNVILPKNRVK